MIWNSIVRTPDFKKYFTKRIFRIYPELWICVVVELLSIFLTYDKEVGVETYFLFGITQSTIFQFWTPEVLREWGVGVPNGSLWTITVIVQFYILIWCGREFIRKVSVKGLICTLIVLVMVGFISNTYTEGNEALSAKLLNNTCIPYLWIFFLGVLISKYFQKLYVQVTRLVWYLLAIAVIVRYIGADIDCSYPLMKSITAFLLMIGFAYKFPELAIRKDISYGIYIYHMIFVNIAVTYGFTGTWQALISVIILTFLTAWVSYELIVKSTKKKLQIIQSI